MRKISGWMVAIMSLALAACGGDKAFVSGSSSSGGTTSGGSATVASVTVVSGTSTIPSDGSASATITAYVRDANNALLSGVTVTFTASSGGISPSTATTDAGGAATATLITAGEPTLRTITVTAAAGGQTSSPVLVQVVSASSAATVQMGNGTGTNFVPNVLGASSASLAAGASTTLSAYLVQSDGTLYTSSTSVTFNSTCVASGTATITPAATAVTATGIATVTYTAKGCSGTDIVTATATAGSTVLSASVPITVTAAAVGSITFTSATPTNIALKGTGDSGRPESSTVIFKVTDSTGGAVSGATVSFALNTAVGGITLTPATATSDVNGYVQTVVSAGTVATSVKVTATVTSVTPTISSQSSQLTVTTGVPTADSFSLAVGCFNIEGWDVDGTTTSVTARLGDRFQNPVPDGTAVTFSAEGGNILPQCLTTTTTTEGGVCSVNFRSSNPRPADGRVSLLASAIGEESFVDANGNGIFDAGTETFTDLDEAFRDDNESGVYGTTVNGVTNNVFVDFNNDGVYTYGNGKFDGLLCSPSTSLLCGNSSIGIGQKNLIILSGSSPVVTQHTSGTSTFSAIPASISMTANSAYPIVFRIVDARGNVMPGTTTVALSASGAGLSIAAPTGFTVPCAAPTIAQAALGISGVTGFPFTITSGGTTGTGVITLTVTSPKGLTTIFQLNVTVS